MMPWRCYDSPYNISDPYLSCDSPVADPLQHIYVSAATLLPSDPAAIISCDSHCSSNHCTALPSDPAAVTCGVKNGSGEPISGSSQTCDSRGAPFESVSAQAAAGITDETAALKAALDAHLSVVLILDPCFGACAPRTPGALPTLPDTSSNHQSCQ